MEILLETRSQKPDNWVEGPFGFGCADFSPDSGSSRYRGFVVHSFYYT
jgi:hypothetical protein